MTCTACGAASAAGQRFCTNCGRALAMGDPPAPPASAPAPPAASGCPHCGATLPPGQSYCISCGNAFGVPAAAPVASEAPSWYNPMPPAAPQPAAKIPAGDSLPAAIPATPRPAVRPAYGSSKAPLAVAAIAFLAALGGVGSLFYQRFHLSGQRPPVAGQAFLQLVPESTAASQPARVSEPAPPTAEVREAVPAAGAPARQAAPAPALMQQQPVNAVPPRQPSHLNSGSVVWSGQVDKDALITIEGGRASSGSVTQGALPGTPVMILVEPKDAVAISIAPAPSNGWNRIVLRGLVQRETVVTIRWSAL